jgi:hypothetical protein
VGRKNQGNSDLEVENVHSGHLCKFLFFNLLSRYSICYYSVDFRPDNRAYELKHTGSLHLAFDLTYQ